MTDAELAKSDPAFWASYHKIRLQKGHWSFDKRKYLVEPMTSAARKQCFMKGKQGGFTEMEVNRDIHGMIYGRYPGGVLYLFPTAKDVGDFSQSRFGPLIEANPKTIGAFISKTNSTFLKRVGNANLFLRGGTLAKSLDFNARICCGGATPKNSSPQSRGRCQETKGKWPTGEPIRNPDGSSRMGRFASVPARKRRRRHASIK